MTREEATRIRELHLIGRPVMALELQEAIHVLSKRRDKRMSLPRMSEYQRERMNSGLLYRLGMVLGRIEERKAA